jgi:hypothetical protein
MKGIIAYDDLDAAEGKRTIASETVPLSLDGQDVEVDLSEEHASALREFLHPYLVAGGAFTSKASSGAGGKWTERRDYLKLYRRWAAKNGVHYISEGGSYYYSKDGIAQFDAWLATSRQQLAPIPEVGE